MSSAAVIAPPLAPAFSLAGIPNPKPRGSGPIKVENYPAKLDSGMSDPAQSFGYLRDGKTFAYCEPDICCRNDSARCRFYDENDKEHTWFSPIFFEDGDKPPGDHEKRSLKDIKELPAKEGLAILTAQDGDFHQKPPPVTGTIPYGDELTITYTQSAKANSLRFGAKLPGETAVYSAMAPIPKICVEVPEVCGSAELNGVSVSPSGDELMFLVFVHLPSHGSSFTHLRIETTAFAALVFNDTGMTHHAKKEWAKSAELFTRAVYADPTKELFAFNLACALARQSDARAEQALAHAIKLGGDAVKKRAAKDPDFASVKDAAWFKRVIE